MFAFIVYFSFFYFSFFLFSCLIPLFYVYFFSDTESLNLFFITYYFYFKKIKYFKILFNFFVDPNFIYYIGYFTKLVPFSVFLTFSLYLSPVLLSILKVLITVITTKVFYFFALFFTIIKVYCFDVFNIFKDILALFIFFKNSVFGDFSLLNVAPLLAIYKNFLFSDNFVIFSFFVLESLHHFTFLLLLDVTHFCIENLSSMLGVLLPSRILQTIESNFSYLYDSFLAYFCSIFIKFLDYLIPILNSYLKDLTFFGLLST